MSQIHFIEGPVGAGKSTYARAMAADKALVHVALDEWFARLFSPDRPQEDMVRWYVQRKDRLLELILDHARAILATRNDVILELGLIQRGPRQAVFRQMQQEQTDFTVHLLDAPLEVRRERVKRRNVEQGATFSMVVPDNMFEMASAMWEPPDEVELESFRFVRPGPGTGGTTV